MTDEERAVLEGADRAPSLMVPLMDNQALGLFVIHALRDMSFQQRETASALRDMRSSVDAMKEVTIRMELCIADVAVMKTQLEELKAAENRRHGMTTLVEWLGRYFPWLVAGFAAIWALRGGLESSRIP